MRSDRHGSWRHLRGEIGSDGLILAPLSGLPCVLYQLQISWLQRITEGTSRPASETGGLVFSLRTVSEQLLIDARGACLKRARARRHHHVVGPDPETDSRLATVYQRLGRRLPRVVRCVERRLSAGDVVDVAGWVCVVPDPRGLPRGYRQPPTIALLRASALRVVR